MVSVASVVQEARDCTSEYGGGEVGVTRMHLLLYFVQGFHLALKGRPLMPCTFTYHLQGPVCEEFHSFSISGVWDGEEVGDEPERKGLSLEEVQIVRTVVLGLLRYADTAITGGVGKMVAWRGARDETFRNMEAAVIDERLMAEDFRRFLGYQAGILGHSWPR